MTQLAETEYNIGECRDDGIAEGIRNALYQLTHSYNGRSYIGDAVAECADYNVPIYNGAVMAEAHHLEEYANQAVEEGLYLINKDFSVVQLFRVAWYMAIEEAIYENMPAVIYNIMVRYINDELSSYEDDDAVSLLSCDDVEAMESELMSRREEFDNNSLYLDIEESAREVLEMFIA